MSTDIGTEQLLISGQGDIGVPVTNKLACEHRGDGTGSW